MQNAFSTIPTLKKTSFYSSGIPNIASKTDSRKRKIQKNASLVRID